jgi:tRNA(fMet)-specific endonuclease VapC
LSLRYLLDTSTLSWAIAPTPNRRVVDRLSKESPTCAVAAPVWHELSYGCARLPAGKRRQELEAFLEVVAASFPILPYDRAASSWHARERARLEKAGRPAPFVDAQIASIAHVANLTLVTANPRDFATFKGLRVQDWT